MNFIHFIKVIIINNTRSVNCARYNNKILGNFYNSQMVFGGSVLGMTTDAGVV